MPLPDLTPEGASFYGVLWEALRRQPPASFEQDLLVNIPRLFLDAPRAAASPRRGYVRIDKTFFLQDLHRGDKALFWNGAQLGVSDYPGRDREWSGDYADLGQKVVDMVKRTGARTVVELNGGCGIGGLHVYLSGQYRSVDLRIVNIEPDADAVRCADFIAACHNLPVRNICLDMKAALDRPDDLVALERMLEKERIIFVTHETLHPHFSDAQCEALFDFVINDLPTAAGAHRESLGFRTADYARILEMLSSPPNIAPSLAEAPSDPFRVLMGGGFKLSVTERQEILPHFLLRDFPSYVGWERTGD